MTPTKFMKDSKPHAYNKVLPPTTQTPGARTTGSNAGSGMQGRTPSTSGRGKFAGGPPGAGAGCDWGSPHKMGRISAEGHRMK